MTPSNHGSNRDPTPCRQIERRIKRYSGRSLREWRMLVKTEGALFAGLQRHHAGLPLDLAALRFGIRCQ